jgi:hypothetical protein
MRPSHSSASSFSDESSCLVQVMDASGIWLMTIRGQKCEWPDPCEGSSDKLKKDSAAAVCYGAVFYRFFYRFNLATVQ